MSNTEAWVEGYKLLTSNPPKAGDLLRAKSGPIKLEMKLESGSAPFIFTRAYVPPEVGGKLEWLAQGSQDGFQVFGWKLIMAPRAVSLIIRRLGIHDFVEVEAVNVIRISRSGTSLIGEVAEWCDAAIVGDRSVDGENPPSEADGNIKIPDSEPGNLVEGE